jgi:hypothetical protein
MKYQCGAHRMYARKDSTAGSEEQLCRLEAEKSSGTEPKKGLLIKKVSGICGKI